MKNKHAYLVVNDSGNIVAVKYKESEEPIQEGFTEKRAVLLDYEPILYKSNSGKWVLEDVGGGHG